MGVVIIFYMCRYSEIIIFSPILCDLVIHCPCIVTVTKLCSPMPCEWLLYYPCFVTATQLNLPPCYVSGYYIVHVYSL